MRRVNDYCCSLTMVQLSMARKCPPCLQCHLTLIIHTQQWIVIIEMSISVELVGYVPSTEWSSISCIAIHDGRVVMARAHPPHSKWSLLAFDISSPLLSNYHRSSICLDYHYILWGGNPLNDADQVIYAPYHRDSIAYPLCLPSSMTTSTVTSAAWSC
jgi:hypothetical protein